jgi:prevent-host-death family protein
MRKYSYTQARQKLAEVLDTARVEDVLITRRSGEVFRVTRHRGSISPFDVPVAKSRVKTEDILAAVRDARRPKS